VCAVSVTLRGAEGGTGAFPDSSSEAVPSPSGGGLGGSATTVGLAVTPGETLTVDVGGKGADGEGVVPTGNAQVNSGVSSAAPGDGGAGGFNGGGNGGDGPSAGGGGGGATDVRRGDTVLVVAGGGGGSSGGGTGSNGAGGGGGSGVGPDGTTFENGVQTGDGLAIIVWDANVTTCVSAVVIAPKFTG
jgi:hypothetical protein